MCDSGHLTEQLFESIPRLKAGQCVYVVALNPSAGDGVEIESILYCEATDTPQTALEDFCKARGWRLPIASACLSSCLRASSRRTLRGSGLFAKGPRFMSSSRHDG